MKLKTDEPSIPEDIQKKITVLQYLLDQAENLRDLSYSTLHWLKHNKDVSTKTLNDLCRILKCDIADIIRYLPSDTDQPL